MVITSMVIVHIIVDTLCMCVHCRCEFRRRTNPRGQRIPHRPIFAVRDQPSPGRVRRIDPAKRQFLHRVWSCIFLVLKVLVMSMPPFNGREDLKSDIKLLNQDLRFLCPQPFSMAAAKRKAKSCIAKIMKQGVDSDPSLS